MKGVTMRTTIASSIMLGWAVVAVATEAPEPQIVVGPNILVSRYGDVAHCETMITANPKETKNVLGT